MTSILLCCIVTYSFGAGRVAVNKSDQFSVADKDNSLQVKDTAMADKIRKQKSAFAVADAQDNANSAMKSSMASNTNKCDKDLRDCMKSKCGSDFAKCAIDGDTDLGIKYDACKTKTSCNAKEFTLFTNQITEDIRFYAKISSYEKVIKCGNDYNDCIIKQCGTTFNKCLGKAQGDEALSKCATIAKNCTEQDSGLSARVGEVFGTLRQDAEKDIKKDEERMYKLRDLMRQQCEHLGALFDERSFDCVYTVNFFAGSDQSKPMSSRKAYAGGTFTCMQEWFGIDVTTYKENAYRLTKSQTGASSAMMGAGVGVAAGMITSGALDRAVKTQKAEKDLKKAEKANKRAEKEEAKEAKAQRKADKEEAKDKEKEAKKKKKEEEKERLEKECLDGGGKKYVAGVCNCPLGQLYSEADKKCKDLKDITHKVADSATSIQKDAQSVVTAAAKTTFTVPEAAMSAAKGLLNSAHGVVQEVEGIIQDGKEVLKIVAMVFTGGTSGIAEGADLAGTAMSLLKGAGIPNVTEILGTPTKTTHNGREALQVEALIPCAECNGAK